MTESLMARLLESWVVTGVLLVLVSMSAICWFVIIYKYLYFRKIRTQSRSFMDAFWQSRHLDAIYQRAEELSSAPVSKVFKAGYMEISRLRTAQDQKNAAGVDGTRPATTDDDGLQNVERALKRAMLNETTELERLVPFLATTSSAAPFIGLFGTVWGIMEAFAHINPNQNLLTSVAPHIAEALVATAIGLLAAIPAVMAYNFFVRKIRLSVAEIESFSAEFLNVVRRHIL
ncbi:MAG: MotA/TolQ/ExbB proton channel family protein [Myxococcales bacterium]|nr:MotA/TolQ/ExbB proton channel family protein [Myxococcales bacterium]